MNQIGQSLIPTLPASSKPNPPGMPDKEWTEDGGSFDSLLQQRTDEPENEGSPAEPATSEAAPVQLGEKPDAALQAGLMAMFTPPAIVPLPVPVPITQSDFIGTNPVDEDNAIVSPTFPAQPATVRSPIPFPQASGQTPAVASQTPLSAPEPLPQAKLERPAPKENAEILPREKTVPLREVANVLGIIPPVQPPTPVLEEPTVRSAKPAVPSQGEPALTRPASVISDAPEFPAGPGTPAPAISAARNEQPTLAEAAAPAPKLPEAGPIPAPKLVSEAVTVISVPEKITGMTAAKPGSVMSAPTLQRPQRPTTATPAEVWSHAIAPEAMPNDGTQTFRNAPMLAAENPHQDSANEHSEYGERPPTIFEIASTNFAIEPFRTNAGKEATAPIEAKDVAQVVTHTLQATERLRVSGQERVDLALKLDNGQELTIQLRVANGQVTPLIRTDSEPLRVALEQNWTRFSQNGGDRELRITAPVFESPQTSSNMSDPNQQRDGRQRAFHEPVPEFFQQALSRRNPTPSAPRPPVSTGTPASGVRLYA